MATPMAEIWDAEFLNEMQRFVQHDEKISKLRKKELNRLSGCTYVDYAGCAPYLESHLDAHFTNLRENTYGNPHSGNSPGRNTQDLVEQVRFRILRHFNTTPDKYAVVFTAGCTDALKLLAYNFNFQGNEERTTENIQSNERCTREIVKKNENRTTENNVEVTERNAASNDDDSINSTTFHKLYEGRGGGFYYLDDNHTSVVGMRDVARDKGASVYSLTEEFFRGGDRFKFHLNSGNNLFAYPAQSNFSGKRYPLTWVNLIQKAIKIPIGGRDSCANEITTDSDCNQGQNYVLLDATGYLCTSQLDLCAYQPDFIPVSFYKIFGFPTGLGALLVRRSSAHTLKKTYFGGGTVQVSLAHDPLVVHKDDVSNRFEDGTINFLDIIALKDGFDALENFTGGFDHLSAHTFSLARCLYRYLTTSCHGNGRPVAKVYCDTGFSSVSAQGPVVAFNLLNSEGDFVGFATVARLAEAERVELRAGCFCNLGACQRLLRLSTHQIKANYKAGHVCGDDLDLVEGQPTGCVRVSLGYASTMCDVINVINFIEACFVQGRHKMEVQDDYDKLLAELLEASIQPLRLEGKSWENDTIENNKMTTVENERRDVSDSSDEYCDAREDYSEEEDPRTGPGTSSVQGVGAEDDPRSGPGTSSAQGVGAQPAGRTRIHGIFIYPVKSCAGFEVQNWPLGGAGLLHDREWMIVTSSGVSVNQKRQTKLALIQPTIDRNKNQMLLNFPGMAPVSVPLVLEDAPSLSTLLCNSKVCGDRIEGVDCGDEVADWLGSILGCHGYRLLQQNARIQRKPAGDADGTKQLSLANEAQYLMVNTSSINYLHEKVSAEGDSSISVEDLVRRLRPNLVVGGEDLQPFSEDQWQQISIGSSRFQVEKLCSRCGMICIDQRTGEKSRQPLLALSQIQGRKNTFGILLRHLPMESLAHCLSVGDPVDVLKPESSAP